MKHLFWLKAYGGALLAIAVLDGLWLGLLARDFYQEEMGALLAPELRIWAAAVFYFGYPAGLVALVLNPRPDRLKDAAARAALVGAMAYGTYDFTNLATLQGWTIELALVDVAWGVVVSALAGSAAWWATRRSG